VKLIEMRYFSGMTAEDCAERLAKSCMQGWLREKNLRRPERTLLQLMRDRCN
jgi:hypothetical protein